MSPWGFESHILCMIRYTVRDNWIHPPPRECPSRLLYHSIRTSPMGVHRGPVTIEERECATHFMAYVFPTILQKRPCRLRMADTD